MTTSVFERVLLGCMGISLLLMVPLLVDGALFVAETEGGLLLAAVFVVGLIPGAAWLGFSLVRAALSSSST